MLKRGYTRETSIRRDRGGRWFDGEIPIEHPGLIASFDAWIDRAPDGRFCLSNDINWAFVAIDGAPYFVRSLNLADMTVELSGGGREPLDLDSLRVGPDDALWCDVRGGRVPAVFDNHAATQLAPLLSEDDEGPYLTVGERVVRPLRVEDPLSGWTPDKGHVE